MPKYRLLHANYRTGRRSKKLTELELITWLAYQQSADDFGVCPASVAKLRGDDPWLKERSAKSVEACVATLLHVGLIASFTDDDDDYWYQPDWQKYQRIKYPSETTYPAIPAELLAQCEEKTVALFLHHHPQRLTTFRDRFSDLPTASANALTRSGDQIESGTGGDARHPIKDLLAEHERLFVERYGTKPAKYGAKEARHAKDLIASHGFDRAARLLRQFFASSDPFIASSGHGLGLFAAGNVQNKLIAESAGPRGSQPDGLAHRTRTHLAKVAAMERGE